MTSAPSKLTSNLVHRYLGVACLLAILIPLTFVAERVLVGRVAPNTETIAQRKVDATLDAVQSELNRLLHQMEADAQDLAEDRVVQQVLSDSTTRTPTLVRPVLEAVSGSRSLYSRSPLQSVELYRLDGALFAWSGYAAPLDRLTARTGIPDTMRTAVALDGPARRTLTLWLPVRRGEEVIGAVRVMRRAQVSVPVRNEFLQDYDLADEWRSDALPPFSVLFSDGQTGTSVTTPLLGIDGTRLGWISVDVPSESFLTGQFLGITHGVVAFWFVLLTFWLMAGFWFFMDHRMRGAADRNPGGGSWPAGLLLVGWCLAWWAMRVGFLQLDVPARWLGRWEPGAALFDPNFLASSFGFGFLKSAADLIVTAFFSVVFSLVVLRVALFKTTTSKHLRKDGKRFLQIVGSVVAFGLGVGAIVVFAVGTQHSVLDATLGYFDQSGPIPEKIAFVVLMALLAGAFSAITFGASCALFIRLSMSWTKPANGREWKSALALTGVLFAIIAIINYSNGTPTWAIITLFMLACVTWAFFLIERRENWSWPLTFRGILFCVLLLVPLTYVNMSAAERQRENLLIEEAAEDFARGQDPRAVYAIEQVINEANSRDLRSELVGVVKEVEGIVLRRADSLTTDSLSVDSALADSLQTGSESQQLDPPAILQEDLPPDSAQVALDDVISRLVSGSLLASLSDYVVDLAVLSPIGDTLTVYAGDVSFGNASTQNGRVAKDDVLAFDSLRNMYQSDERARVLVVRSPVGSQRGTYRYAGIGPVQTTSDSLAGWLYVLATPLLSRPMDETPYPSVLVPTALMSNETAAMSYSEYDNGVLVRSRGVVPGPFQLEVGVRNAFAGNRTEYWRREVIEEHPYRAYYQRIPAGEKLERLDAIAVRIPAPSGLDHMFNLVRMTIAGLLLGLLVYLCGLLVRRRAGILSAGQSHFRDKVLSRFLIVGIVTVAVTGIIGRGVILAQNEQAVEDLLRARLQRVETAVTAEAGPGTPVSASLQRASAGMVSSQLGIDLNVYIGYQLASTSRPQLVRQRLIDERLPADVYQALYAEGRRYAFTDGRIGSFTYTIGYKAIANELGQVIGVVAVPTLPEQASIEAGQARMIAYLFAVLLLLMLGIFATTALLANQLTRPFKSLREGLKAVGGGQTYEPIPVETKDEIGQLVESFNEMQSQLKESRQQLAAQERELAWREMARQVAHEIKNPLTPMKLSVQHLQRSYRRPGEDASSEERKFGSSLDRITTTLIEQIDALSRIAGEFSSFARLPQRNVESLDLNDVIREAGALFEEEAPAGLAIELKLELSPEPLVIEADREEMRRTYINLLANAFQSMSDGRKGHIVVRTTADGDHVVSDVEDNGVGIPSDVRERIFQPNFSTKTSGMGLGLAIVRKAIEASGGTISFETEEGKGTTFHIRLPLVESAVRSAE